MQIVPYKSEHKKFFTEINARWIEKYFEIEPYDFEQFDRSKEIFIDEDGYIFIGIIEEKPMASFALLKLEDGIFELSKMAVSIEYLGQGYGNQLMKFCIDFAQKNRFLEIILYTHTKLESAVHLYRKFGFKELKLEPNAPYKRANLKLGISFI